MESTAHQEISQRLTIEKLLLEGDQLSKISNIKKILIMGDSGAGKTTILRLIFNIGLKEEVVSCTSEDLFKYLTGSNPLQISHSFTTCTSFPNIIQNENCLFCDCPSFEDNRSIDFVLANAYYMNCFLSSSKSLKFVLVIEYCLINIDAGSALFDAFHKLICLVSESDSNTLLDGLCIVISKCPSTYKKDSFIDRLVSLVNKGQLFKKHSIFFKEIINHPEKIALFKELKPNMEIDQEDRYQVMQSIEFSRFVQVPVKFIIVDPSPTNLCKSYNDQIIDKIEKIKNSLKIKFNIDKNFNTLKNALRVLKKITDKSSSSLDNFSKLLFKLNRFSDDLLEIVTSIKDIIFCLKFYLELLNERNTSFYLTNWLSHLTDLQSEIQDSIDEAIQDEHKMQARDFEHKSSNERELYWKENNSLLLQLEEERESTNILLKTTNEALARVEKIESENLHVQNEILKKIDDDKGKKLHEGKSKDTRGKIIDIANNYWNLLRNMYETII